MAPSTVRFEASTRVEQPVDQVFERLADLPGYTGWMHHDGLFRHCTPTSGPPVHEGSTYRDSTRMGTFDGEVTTCEAPSRLAFRETLRWFGSPMSEARPEYELERDGDATVVHHVAVGTLYGPMRLMKPVAGWMAGRERSRTLRSLARSWEHPGE
ncbi:SRPBCC family protein [Luteimicrobium sp. DT211]|uniref:SRPBCC family protein n=1 Tax=Luteimicrobium sp. DT211 TaxID=3393412 RepID=UPI003CF91267